MNNDSNDKPLTYADAGVDIDAGNALVEAIKPAVRATARPEVLGSIGGFGGLFAVDFQRYRAPVLVSGTDGVGTKLALAQQLNRHDGIGRDLVAMCVNDIVVSGAEPLFFLDYYATGRLNVAQATTVVTGIADGCRDAGCALLGGETAEMPGMYSGDDYDLAGFAVGIVERDEIIDGRDVRATDQIIGLASSGPHSNGYSLIRKVLDRAGELSDLRIGSDAASDVLMAPTTIYVRAVRQVLQSFTVKAMAHITGGGLTENLPRVLPEGLGATLWADRWSRPEVFEWLANQGGIASDEMWRTFNCGIGMALVVDAIDVDPVVAMLNDIGQAAWHIGEITDHAGVRFE
ncbi:MAG: phosphoribosylformylglycinamidine cyclo-ligase [Pseudomonadota bacterium]